jgi:hypothetical protein
MHSEETIHVTRERGQRFNLEGELANLTMTLARGTDRRINSPKIPMVRPFGGAIMPFKISERFSKRAKVEK